MQTAPQIFLRSCALTAAIAIGGLFLGAQPAAAQEQAPASQAAPWYMPQPWMTPQATLPQGKVRPGQYSYSRHKRNSYGSFVQGCYGQCGKTRGVIVTSAGVVLFKPTIVYLDARDFQIVRRGSLLVQQPQFIVRQNPAVLRQKQIAALPKAFVDRHPSLQLGLQKYKPSKPMIANDKGVRIFRPNTLN